MGLKAPCKAGICPAQGSPSFVAPRDPFNQDRRRRGQTFQLLLAEPFQESAAGNPDTAFRDSVLDTAVQLGTQAVDRPDQLDGNDFPLGERAAGDQANAAARDIADRSGPATTVALQDGVARNRPAAWVALKRPAFSASVIRE